MRQAEVESSQSRLESLENQTGELHHLLREATDRASALSDDLSETQRHLEDARSMSSSSTISSAPIAGAIADVERRYETKLSDLRTRMTTIERERTEAEEEWSRNLAARSREIDRLRSEAAVRESSEASEASGRRALDEERMRAMERELIELRSDKGVISSELAALKTALEQAKDSEVSSVARLLFIGH